MIIDIYFLLTLTFDFYYTLKVENLTKNLLKVLYSLRKGREKFNFKP